MRDSLRWLARWHTVEDAIGQMLDAMETAIALSEKKGRGSCNVCEPWEDLLRHSREYRVAEWSDEHHRRFWSLVRWLDLQKLRWRDGN